jgi:hypothetical protein
MRLFRLSFRLAVVAPVFEAAQLYRCPLPPNSQQPRAMEAAAALLAWLTAVTAKPTDSVVVGVPTGGVDGETDAATAVVERADEGAAMASLLADLGGKVASVATLADLSDGRVLSRIAAFV